MLNENGRYRAQLNVCQAIHPIPLNPQHVNPCLKYSEPTDKAESRQEVEVRVPRVKLKRCHIPTGLNLIIMPFVASTLRYIWVFRGPQKRIAPLITIPIQCQAKEGNVVIVWVPPSHVACPSQHFAPMFRNAVIDVARSNLLYRGKSTI
jgi:hypothetical protein